MKNVKRIENIYLEKYDVSVKPYLTYAEVQNIVDQARKHDSWAMRQQCIDMITLIYATDIGEEKINEIGHDTLYTSGLIDSVMMEIENIHCIYDALGYEESLMKMLARLPQDLEKLKDIADEVKKNANGKK